MLALLLAGATAACGGSNEADHGATAVAERPPPQTRGFVLTDFTFEQPVTPENGCPEGWNLNERDLYVAELGGTDPETAAAVPAGFDYIRMARERGGLDPCKEPAGFEGEPHFTVQGLEVSPGFDLDGVHSTPRAPGKDMCQHEDLIGPGGERGIDNQLWSVLGCIWGYERGSTIDEYSIINIKDGQRTILIQLSGIDDARNDGEVEVGIYSSPDPIPADAAGQLLSGASLSATDDPRYQNVIRGQLVDGVVLAGPFDLRLDFNGQFLDSEYIFKNAQLRLELLPDGSARGLLGGYWDIEHFYDAYARQATRSGAFSVGFRCPGMYAALKSRADAFPDPATGACTAVSTTFRIVAIAAFVIEPDATAVAAMR